MEPTKCHGTNLYAHTKHDRTRDHTLGISAKLLYKICTFLELPIDPLSVSTLLLEIIVQCYSLVTIKLDRLYLKCSTKKNNAHFNSLNLGLICKNLDSKKIKFNMPCIKNIFITFHKFTLILI